MSSREYIEQAINGKYLSIPIRYLPNSIPCTSADINTLKKKYEEWRLAIGTEVHTAKKSFIINSTDGSITSVRFVRYQNQEFIYIFKTNIQEGDESCSLFLEVGKQDLLSVGIDAETTLNPAELYFSDGTLAEYMGKLSAGAFKIQDTPTIVDCGDEGDLFWEHWGLSSGTLTEGESLIITKSICGR